MNDQVKERTIEAKNSTNLDLSNCKLEEIPKAIFQLRGLTALNLKNNQLSSVPESIPKLSSYLFLLFLSLIQIHCEPKPKPTPKSVTFTVIGDVPYNELARTALIDKIEKHNSLAASSFVVHVGDIKSGKVPCEESSYEEVSTILSGFVTPTFMLLGDNEFNDCEDPVEARQFWDHYFLDFHKKWEFKPMVITQTTRTENWAWVQEDILFIGLNIVGSVVHDEQEWKERMADNATWLRSKYQEYEQEVDAIVVFGHANMVDFGKNKFTTITTELIDIAAAFDKPMVYIHGDGHRWIDDHPWSAPNLRRIQITGGQEFLEVTIDPEAVDLFTFIPD